MQQALRLHSLSLVPLSAMFAFYFLSSFPFLFHNLVNSVDVAANQCFFLRAAPTFYFVLPLKRLWIGFYNFTPNKLNGATIKCIRFRMHSRLMLFEATFQFSG